MKLIEAYLCDFCGRVIFNKEDMEKHESECERNPENKQCCTCKHEDETPHVEPCKNCNNGNKWRLL